MIGFLVRGSVRIKVWVRVRVTFNISVCHWSNCRRSRCHTFYSRNAIMQECTVHTDIFRDGSVDE